jgi:hypothetical protein
MECIYVIQDEDQLPVCENTVMNLRISWKAVNILIMWVTVSFSRRTTPHSASFSSEEHEQCQAQDWFQDWTTYCLWWRHNTRTVNRVFLWCTISIHVPVEYGAFGSVLCCLAIYVIVYFVLSFSCVSSSIILDYWSQANVQLITCMWNIRQCNHLRSQCVLSRGPYRRLLLLNKIHA